MYCSASLGYLHRCTLSTMRTDPRTCVLSLHFLCDVIICVMAGGATGYQSLMPTHSSALTSIIGSLSILLTSIINAHSPQRLGVHHVMAGGAIGHQSFVASHFSASTLNVSPMAGIATGHQSCFHPLTSALGLYSRFRPSCDGKWSNWPSTIHAHSLWRPDDNHVCEAIGINQ